MLLVPAPFPVNPLHEREVFDVSFRTDCYEPTGDQPWSPVFQALSNNPSLDDKGISSGCQRAAGAPLHPVVGSSAIEEISHRVCVDWQTEPPAQAL